MARLTFLEARQRRLLLLILLMGLAFLVLFAVGFYLAHNTTYAMVGERREVTNFLLLTALYAANFLGVVLAVVMSVDIIAGEIASGAIHTVVTKPLRRWQVVLGKWLGLAVLLSVIMLAITGAMLAIAWVIAGYVPPNAVQGIALMVLAQLVILSVSIFGGTFLNTLANGVFVFMLYGLAFIAGWIEQIGSFIRNETAVDIGILISFILPAEAIWRRASYLMQPPFLRELGFSPFQAASAPSGAMVIYALGYVLLLLYLAVRTFQARDL
jgi:ABC-type transport system involved in multi-copper enzyme maturation permease subunit